jgi:hypothetical protein
MTTITRGTITGKGWSMLHDCLLRAATSRYQASLRSLPSTTADALSSPPSPQPPLGSSA